MRSTNTFGVSFYPKQNRNQRKDYSIIATITCNDSPPRDITIKGAFDIKNWDKGKGQPNLLHYRVIRGIEGKNMTMQKGIGRRAVYGTPRLVDKVDIK